MKKLFSVLISVLVPIMMSAQLKAPTETSADTLMVLQCSYQDMDISAPADWPCRFFTESVSKIYIAGNIYKKNAPTFKKINEYDDSWGGHMDYFSYGNATVNGTSAAIYKVLSRSDCEDYPLRKYGIDDYAFYVVTIDDAIKHFGDDIGLLRLMASWEMASKEQKLKMVDEFKPLVPDLENMSNDRIVAGVDSVFLSFYNGL